MSLSTGSGSRPFYVAEPPAQYLARPPVVVDCSVLVGILFEEPWQAQASEKIRGRTLNCGSQLFSKRRWLRLMKSWL